MSIREKGYKLRVDGRLEGQGHWLPHRTCILCDELVEMDDFGAFCMGREYDTGSWLFSGFFLSVCDLVV